MGIQSKKVDYEVIEFQESRYKTGVESVFKKDDFGICYNCKHLQAFRTKYGRVYGRCYTFEITFSGIDPPEYCSGYNKKGELPLDMMYSMATFIEKGKIKREAGFMSRDLMEEE